MGIEIEVGSEQSNTPVADRIRKRIQSEVAQDIQYFANHNISRYIDHKSGELGDLVSEVEVKVRDLLDTLLIDREDHNSSETAHRVAKMLILETMAGRYYPQPKVTDFPNITNYDQIYLVGSVRVTSLCSHHLQPINGTATLGIYPTDRVIGLSKFERLTDWIMRRPQIQEEATIMLANLLEEIVKPRGLALVVRANHGCCSNRGIMNQDLVMTTSVMRGVFLDSMEMRQEFFSLSSLK
jgi:GTP cyclohydrolase I